MLDEVIIVDLFCGAGGASEGAIAAAKQLQLKPRIYAVNCWQAAVDTYKLNHPEAMVLCQRVEQVVPEQLVPGRRVNLLVAGPECTHHSQARGGMPVDDQHRVPAWVIPNWLQRTVVDYVLIENVPEFTRWGPLGANGKPLKSKQGEIFKSYIAAIEACGYTVDYKVLCCADYGDATTRKRLFIQAWRKGAPQWPVQTHISRSKLKDQTSLFMTTPMRPWKAAREIIDWDLKGTNIFDRKKPLAQKTMARIAAGMKKINGIDIEPFLVKLYGTGKTASVRDPLPTVTAKGNHLALAQPFVLSQASGGAARPVEDPIPTICAGGAEQLVEPFVVPNFGERPNQEPRTHSVKEPLPTATSHGAGCLVEPFVVDQFNTHAAKPVGEPLGTLTTTSRGVRLLDPFVVAIDQQGREAAPGKIDNPLSTITTKARHAVLDPFVVGCGGRRAQSPPRGTNEPLNTVTTKGDACLCEPFTISAGGPKGKGRHPHPIDDPIGTVLTETRTRQ